MHAFVHVCALESVKVENASETRSVGIVRIIFIIMISIIDDGCLNIESLVNIAADSRIKLYLFRCLCLAQLFPDDSIFRQRNDMDDDEKQIAPSTLPLHSSYYMQCAARRFSIFSIWHRAPIARNAVGLFRT